MGLISRVSSRTYSFQKKKNMSTPKESKDQKFKTLDKEQQVKIFEDDDEFEEFPTDSWGPKEEAGNTLSKNAWQENWDDDDIEDDFSQKLKEILKNKSHIKN